MMILIVCFLQRVWFLFELHLGGLMDHLLFSCILLMHHIIRFDSGVLYFFINWWDWVFFLILPLSCLLFFLCFILPALGIHHLWQQPFFLPVLSHSMSCTWCSFCFLIICLFSLSFIPFHFLHLVFIIHGSSLLSDNSAFLSVTC